MNALLLWNSVLLALGATALALFLGGSVGLWAWSVRGTVRVGLWVASLTTLVMPPFFLTNTWLDFMVGTAASPGSGNSGFFSIPGAMFLLGLQLWPIATLAIWAAEGSLTREQFECEPGLSGTPLLRFLILPSLGPFVAVAGVLIFALALNQFSVPSLLQVHVLSAEIWIRYATELDPRKAWQLGWPLMVVPMLGLWLIPKWTRFRFRWQARDWTDLFAERLGRGYFFCAVGVGTMALLFSLVLPWTRTLFASRTWSQWGPAWETSHRAIAHSFAYAAATATSAVCVAAGFAWWKAAWADGRKPRGFLFEGWMQACVKLHWVFLFLPGTAIGIALIDVSTTYFSGSLHSSFLGGWIALHLHYGALGTHFTWQSIQSLDLHLLEASRVYAPGRSFWVRHVLWPSIGSTVLAGWYGVYLLSLWDIESLVLLQVPGRDTLALRIFNLLHYGHNDQVNALALQLLLVALTPLAALGLYRVLRRTTRGVWRGRLAAVSMIMTLCGCSPPAASPPVSLNLNRGLFRSIERVGGRGTAAGEFNKPRSLTVDAQDNLYVVDMTGRVQKFSPTGQFLLMWQLPQTDLGKPKGMSRDLDGNILVVEPHYQRINHFSPDGKLLRQWGQHGNELGQFVLPRAVTVGSNHLLYVSEYTTVDRVQAFEFPSLKFQFAFGKSGSGDGEFNRPESLCVDRQNHVFVADSCNHRIEFFSERGEYLGAFGKPGTGEGELSYPYDVQIDGNGHCFVCEFGNSRIQIFDAQHKPLETLGGYGDALDRFNNPWSLALDSKGNLYVADAGNHRVLKYFRR